MHTVQINLPSIGMRYLAGPRDAATVRKMGYGFTPNASEAWPFKNAAQASAKSRVVNRHMRWAGDYAQPVEITP